jgi:hypothetical protein
MQVFPQAQRGASASIEGIVLRFGGSEPISGARISLRNFVSGSASSNAPVLNAADEGAAESAIAGPDGRFILKDVPPGAYRVFATRDGYVGQEYEQPSPNRPGVPVVLEAGQALKGVAFHLGETGNISGRIRDLSGQPVEGVQVQALRLGYGADGHKTLQPMRTATTNDRGEFRVYWIPPGRYSLLASRIDSPGGRPSETPRINFAAAAYYPGVPDPSNASVIAIQPGTELASMDWQLPQSRLRVSGRVFDPATGQPPKAASIAIVQRDFGPAFVGASSTQWYKPEDGTFVVPDLGPGVYWVSALLGGGGGSSGFRNTYGSIANNISTGDQVMVQVTQDVSNVLLTPIPAFSISGLFVVEGTSNVQDTAMIRIGLHGAPAIVRTGPIPAPNLDGTFVLGSLGPGDYKLNVTKPADFYVKQARYGSSDILGRTFSIQRPGTDSLHVVLSAFGGRIDGTVEDERAQPVRGVEVVLVPDRARDRIDLYQQIRTDQSGSFTMRGIPPGDYKLFAWDDIEPFAFFDPDILRRAEPNATPVRVVESSKERVNVRLIVQ